MVGTETSIIFSAVLTIRCYSLSLTTACQDAVCCPCVKCDEDGSREFNYSAGNEDAQGFFLPK